MKISGRLLLAGLAFASLLAPPCSSASETGAATGRIVGKARRAADGTPIAKGEVRFISVGGFEKSARVIDGAFASPDLAPGTYYALMTDTAAEVGQIYGGPPCPIPPSMGSFCGRPKDLGEKVEVSAGRDTPIEFSLLAGAFVTGSVFPPAGARKDARIRLEVIDANSQLSWIDDLPLPATFRAGPLPPGRYNVRASNHDATEQLNGGHVCIAGCGFREEAAIALAPGEVRGQVELRLVPYGRLAGRVVERGTSEGVGSVDMVLFEPSTRRRHEGRRTEKDGTYSFERLPPGKYLLAARAPWRESLVYPGISFKELQDEPMMALARALIAGETVTVPPGGKLELPPLELAPHAQPPSAARGGEEMDAPPAGKGRIVGGATLAGNAKRAADRVKIRDGFVHFVDAEGGDAGQARVRNGSFFGPPLDPGIYFAYMRNTTLELGQVWSRTNCHMSLESKSCDPRKGREIFVEADRDTLIAFDLIPGAFLVVEVFAPGGLLAENARVEVLDDRNEVIWSRHFPTPRHFRAGPFLAGRYRVRASAPGLATRIYSSQDCFDACALREGEGIELPAGETRGIELHLPLPSGENRLP